MNADAARLRAEALHAEGFCIDLHLEERLRDLVWRDIDRLVGWTVTMGSGDWKQQRVVEAERMVERTKREYEDAVASLAAMRVRAKEGSS